MNTKPKELSIGDIFNPKNNETTQLDKYVIPRYQRNYAWLEPHIKQLIQDIYDYSNRTENTKNYYLGSLVVYERAVEGDIHYETIDGQQRLTTLNILFSVLKNEFHFNIRNFEINLRYDSRPKSSYTLEYLYNPKTRKDGYTFNQRILEAYEIIKKELKKIDTKKLNSFVDYLNESVKLLRVPVPKDTDLNHYFEIMNSRGEQLEKHEVLKANMLDVFKKDAKSTHVFNTIWEACANMEKYVQYGFSTYKEKGEHHSVRDLIFGADWTSFVPRNFDEVVNCFKTVSDKSDGETMLHILGNEKGDISKNKEGKKGQERFTTTINFSNFLLHVLKVLVNQSNKYIIVSETEDETTTTTKTKKSEDVPLDDKRLLDTFNDYLDNDSFDKKEFVEDFGYHLLKLKNKYDKYVIKRDGVDEKWSLKQLKVSKGNHSYINTFSGNDDSDGSSENQKVILLLSMFHVSAPTLIYKHWLNAVLNYVLNRDEVNENEYIFYLEQLSDAYLYDNFLAEKDERVDYYDIIYTNNGKRSRYNNINIEAFLNKGTGVENFIFNRLDYLLYNQWEEQKNNIPEELRDPRFFNSKIDGFSFNFRSSVEHYYPQNPHNEEDVLENKSVLNNFGNLCLISSSQNSKLSNLLPEGKKSHYSPNDIESESIKQRLMMCYKNWNTTEIEDHYKKMKTLLMTTAVKINKETTNI